ncbi:MAG: hypothetical protein R2932_03315 [Caldilineaceae bacterium]
MNKASFLLAEDPSSDLVITAVMADELERYIVEEELYRTVTIRLQSGIQNLQMTGADLLTRLYRLQAEREQLSSEEQAQLDRIVQQTQETIHSLRSRFHERLQREIKTRLDSLKWFLDDCMDEQQQQRCHIEFPFEMRNRQRIEEALKELDDELAHELQAYLRQIDERIRRAASASAFIWDERLRSIFPPTPYWYLYVRPLNRS